MHIRRTNVAKKCVLLVAVLAMPFLTGCGSGNVNFTQNKVASRVKELQGGVDEGLSRGLYQQITNIMGAMFGTPDAPTLMAGGLEEELVDLDNLTRSGGAVAASRLSGEVDADPHLDKGEGLYRQHCVHCHGINGDGKGPTAAF